MPISFGNIKKTYYKTHFGNKLRVNKRIKLDYLDLNLS